METKRRMKRGWRAAPPATTEAERSRRMTAERSPPRVTQTQAPTNEEEERQHQAQKQSIPCVGRASGQGRRLLPPGSSSTSSSTTTISIPSTTSQVYTTSSRILANSGVDVTNHCILCTGCCKRAEEQHEQQAESTVESASTAVSWLGAIRAHRRSSSSRHEPVSDPHDPPREVSFGLGQHLVLASCGQLGLGHGPPGRASRRSPWRAP
jgi:hypothetical protein